MPIISNGLPIYGITEAAILAAGYAPAIGYLHTGKPLSFVYDIADIVKFETVVPAAFRVAARNPPMPEREVRIACRDAFKQSGILQRLIPMIEDGAGPLAIYSPPSAEHPIGYHGYPDTAFSGTMLGTGCG